MNKVELILKKVENKKSDALSCLKDSINHDERKLLRNRVDICDDIIAFIKPLLEEQTMKGWVARQRESVCPNLNFYEAKPHKEDNGWGDKFWRTDSINHNYIRIDSDLFPELTFNDEPIEVEMIIRKV